MGSQDTGLSAATQRKTDDRTDEPNMLSNRMRANGTSDSGVLDNIHQKICLVEEALGYNKLTVDLIIQICEGTRHGPGAYLDWIRTNGPRIIHDQQVLSRMFPGDDENMTYDIFYDNKRDLETNKPSTLTRSINGLADEAT
jgi:hypothetical protein